MAPQGMFAASGITSSLRSSFVLSFELLAGYVRPGMLLWCCRGPDAALHLRWCRRGIFSWRMTSPTNLPWSRDRMRLTAAQLGVQDLQLTRQGCRSGEKLLTLLTTMNGSVTLFETTLSRLAGIVQR